jgi:hypothetical protein
MIADTGGVKFRWWLVVVAVLLVALAGGYLWIQYGGSVVSEGRVKVRVSTAWAGDPVVRTEYVSGTLTGPQPSTSSSLTIDRDQTPGGIAEGDMLDCAYLQRLAPIVNRLREPVLSDCRRVTS